MRTGRPKAELVLSDQERSQLESFARSRSLPAALSNRARLVLASAKGEPNNAIAARLKMTKQTVGKWRTRFIKRRIAGLYDDLRPGKLRTIDDERVAQLIKTTLHTKPADGWTHWSVRTVAAETGISKSSVQRYFQLFGLQPHRSETFKLSNDPFFIEKLRDVVGLYLSPPDNALVICVDEKSQCQALERTPGRVQAAPPASGVARLSARDRQGRAGRVGHPLYRRQLRYPQPSEDQSLACGSATLAHALHSHLQLLAQSGRALLLDDHRQGDPPRLVHQRQATHAAHRSLCCRLQQKVCVYPCKGATLCPMPGDLVLKGLTRIGFDKARIAMPEFALS